MTKQLINKIIGVLLVLLMVGEGVYAYVNKTEESSLGQGQSIHLVHNPWDTEIASTTVIKLVLEEAGFKVKMTAVDNAVMYESIANKQADAMTSAWLPSTHGEMTKAYEGQYQDLGPNLEGTQNGIVVPAYSKLNSIEDFANQLDKTIIGVEPGAGIMLQSQQMMEAYPNLKDWTLESPSTGAMLASLASAIDANKKMLLWLVGNLIGNFNAMT